MGEVAIIGAGPNGLSVAAHLRGANVPYRIFGKPMGLWRDHMPQGMVLKSDGFASNLSAPGEGYTLHQFCKEIGHDYADLGFRTPLETIIRYGGEFQRRFVGPVESQEVISLEQANGKGFTLRLDNGEVFTAKRVVVATGPMAFKRMPNQFHLPDELLSHTSDHTNLTRFIGKNVTILGGGQSALETATLLHEVGANVTVVTRRPLFWFDPNLEDEPKERKFSLFGHNNWGMGPGWRQYFWSEQPLPYHYLPAGFRAKNAYSTFGPAGSGWLKKRFDAVIDGRKIRTLHGNIDVSERSGKVQVKVGDMSPQLVVADHLIAGTGYKADINRVPFLKPLLGKLVTEADVPRLRRGFESSISGLHFCGYVSAVAFGPSMRFIYGTWFSGPQVAGYIASRSVSRRSYTAPATA